MDQQQRPEYFMPIKKELQNIQIAGNYFKCRSRLFVLLDLEAGPSLAGESVQPQV